MLSLEDETWAWREQLAPASKRPFVLGINGPQGAGKTTLARALVKRAAAHGQRAVALSIDDFYLTNAAQKALAARHAGDLLLQQRGYPGTHDVALGAETLAALQALRDGEELAVPAYDKAADGGRGDRRPRAAWPKISGPLDLIILEGWMLGFPAVAGLAGPLAAVNAALPAYAAWHRAFDAFLLLRMAEPRQVVAWRVESEKALRAEGRGGMSDAAAKAYVETFLPAYEVYPDALAAAPPVPKARFRVRVLGPDRRAKMGS